MRMPRTVTAQRTGGNPCGGGIGLDTGSMRTSGRKDEGSSVEAAVVQRTDRPLGKEPSSEKHPSQNKRLSYYTGLQALQEV